MAYEMKDAYDSDKQISLTRFLFAVSTYEWHNRTTCILDGLRTSKDAIAEKDKVENGFEYVTEFSMVRLLVSIDWLIFSTFTN